MAAFCNFELLRYKAILALVVAIWAIFVGPFSLLPKAILHENLNFTPIKLTKRTIRCDSFTLYLRETMFFQGCLK